MIRLDLNPEAMVVSVRGPSDHLFNIRNLLKKYGGRYLDDLGWHLPLDSEVLNQLHAAFHLHGIEYSQNGLIDFFQFERSLRDRCRAGTGLRFAHPCYKTEPFDYQHAGIEWLVHNRRTMLLDKMGLGKTLESIYAAVQVSSKIVVICPNSLKGNWLDELEKHLSTYAAHVTGSSKKDRELAVQTFAQATKTDPRVPTFLIMHYEAMRLMVSFGTRKFGKVKVPIVENLGLLEEVFRGAVVICDEAHRLKNVRTHQSVAIAAIRPLRLWLMTGTPVSNQPEDVWHLTNLVRPGILGFSWSAFCDRHIERGFDGSIEDYKDIERIAQKLSLTSFGREKEEVTSLPEKTFSARRVDLNDSERKTYNQMHRDLIAFIEENIQAGTAPTMAQAANISSRWIRLRQIADGFISEGQGGKYEFVKHPTKIEEAIDIWKDAGEPRLLVWCHFVPMVIHTAKLFQDAGAGRLWFLWGGVSPEQRAQAVRLWSKSEGGVLVCQMDTMGEGHNMQAGNYQIFLDTPLTPRVRKQCVDRQHRIGQRNPVTIIDVIARDTVDVGLYRDLSTKTDMAEAIEAPSFDSSFMRMKREQILEALG